MQVTASIQKSLKFACCSGKGCSVIHKPCVRTSMTRFSLDCEEDWEAQLTVRFTERSWKRKQYRLSEAARCTDTQLNFSKGLSPQGPLPPLCLLHNSLFSPSFAIFHTSSASNSFLLSPFLSPYSNHPEKTQVLSMIIR